MADEDVVPTPPKAKKTSNYSGNSNKEKADDVKEHGPDRPKLEQITIKKGRERKKGLGSKIAASFTGDDAQSTGEYVLFDVIIPTAKAMLSDAVSQGFERLLFGTSSSRSPRRDRGSMSDRQRYSSHSRRDRDRDRDRGPHSPYPRREERGREGRNSRDVGNVVVDTRGEAEEVLDTLTEMINKFDVASVGDLYDLVGISSEFTDNKFGWDADAWNRPDFRRVRDGYLLDLPPTIVLD